MWPEVIWKMWVMNPVNWKLEPRDVYFSYKWECISCVKMWLIKGNLALAISPQIFKSPKFPVIKFWHLWCWFVDKRFHPETNDNQFFNYEIYTCCQPIHVLINITNCLNFIQCFGRLYSTWELNEVNLFAILWFAHQSICSTKLPGSHWHL